MELNYIQISGLKDKEVEQKINQKIKDKMEECKEAVMNEIANEDLDRISIMAYSTANFADVISIYVDKYIHYDYNDDDYENDTYENEEFGLNFSLATGEEIKFKDMFWEDSPIKTILSQSVYRNLAWEYAFAEEDWEWNWDMDNLDYAGIESKVYNFMHQYNQNPDIDFYFTTSNIMLFSRSKSYPMYNIKMEDFYQYIAIYTKYKSNTSLYETDSKYSDFYVFSNTVMSTEGYLQDSGKKGDNLYYSLVCYDNPDEMNEEGKKSLEAAKQAANKKINEYAQTFQSDKNSGYIIDAFFMGGNENDGKYGYSFHIEVAKCSKSYFDNHLEEALAAGAREERVDIAPLNYYYVDKENFEFFETYSEWMTDYTDESTKDSNTYTNADRLEDMRRWEEELEESKIEEVEIEETNTVDM